MNNSADQLTPQRLILASTSRYRAALLRQLNLTFEQLSPDCDETPLPAETPLELVSRLSSSKATSLSAANPGSLIIGSDQVADLAGSIIGKPHTKSEAIKQLGRVSGNDVIFRTGLCLLDSGTGQRWEDVINIRATFRPLTQAEIERYLDHDTPFDCACSFRLEGMGPSLLASLETSDPSALIGLPLIRLSGFLRSAGMPVP